MRDMTAPSGEGRWQHQSRVGPFGTFGRGAMLLGVQKSGRLFYGYKHAAKWARLALYDLPLHACEYVKVLNAVGVHLGTRDHGVWCRWLLLRRRARHRRRGAGRCRGRRYSERIRGIGGGRTHKAFLVREELEQRHLDMLRRRHEVERDMARNKDLRGSIADLVREHGDVHPRVHPRWRSRGRPSGV